MMSPWSPCCASVAVPSPSICSLSTASPGGPAPPDRATASRSLAVSSHTAVPGNHLTGTMHSIFYTVTLHILVNADHPPRRPSRFPFATLGGKGTDSRAAAAGMLSTTTTHGAYLGLSGTLFSPSASPFSERIRTCCGALTSAGGKL